MPRERVTAASTPFAPVDPAPPASEPAAAERYRDIQALGEGGMGEVRLNKDLLIGREVALKAMKPGAGSRSDLRMRFVREARIQGQLEHPSIVPVYDLSLRSEQTFFTMKRVRGVTLEAVIERLAAGDPATVAIHTRRKLLTAFGSVCLAADFAHAHGVVHRDLKPANVMLGDFGEVSVLDWGVAKVSDDPDQAPSEPIEAVGAGDRTEVGAVMGTPGYMAPEQARGGAVDARSDVYSLGAVLFEILTLVPLHAEPTGPAIIASTLAGVEARPSVRAAGRDVPPELEAICVKATALEPEDRFSSTRELYEAVERFLDGDRDIELRANLARTHAKAARVAKERALASSGAPREEARLVALGEIGRALALDPTCEEALAVVLELRAIAPRVLPAEAEADLEGARQDTFRTTAKAGALALVSTLVYLPLAFWMGVRSPWQIIVMYTLVLAAALVTYGPVRSLSRTYVAALLATASFATMSRLLGPFMLLPGAMVACAAGFAVDPSRRRRLFVLGCCCAAILVPWALEWVGVLSPSYVFEQGGIRIVPHTLFLPEGPTTAFLLAATLGTIVSCGMLIGRVRTALEWAEHRLYLQAWQLRQLLPEAARGAADIGSVDSLPSCAAAERHVGGAP
jgi:hypothetical protein